jgi:pimeloyl-ACP methyl ester carboxylesterase
MEGLDLPEGVNSRVVATPRLETHVLTSGPEDGIPVLFVHGNASSSRFFGETLAALASRYRGLAPDLRGFGDSEAKPLDATRGLGDFSDDLADSDPNSPRNVMNNFYFKSPFRAAKEEALLSSVLSTQTGEDNYPGDMNVSENWPGVSPGERGMNNAISPKYCNLEGFARVRLGPPVLWVRGEDDAIVSDTSLLDFGYLGQLDAVPGWPGAGVYPPQPMVSQIRAVLDSYEARGGRYREEVIPDCGHTPHVEKPEEFRRLLFGFLEEQ